MKAYKNYVSTLDISKAFDTFNHSTLNANIATLQLHDKSYELLVFFFTKRTHSTKLFNKHLGPYVMILA